MHAKTYAEIRHVVHPCVFRAEYHSLDAASAEAAGDDYSVNLFQRLFNIVLGKLLCVHPFDFYLCRVFVAGVGKRLGNGKVCVVQLHVFAAKRNFNGFVACGNAPEHFIPFGKVYNSGVKLQALADDFRKTAFFKHNRTLI